MSHGAPGIGAGKAVGHARRLDHPDHEEGENRHRHDGAERQAEPATTAEGGRRVREAGREEHRSEERPVREQAAHADDGGGGEAEQRELGGDTDRAIGVAGAARTRGSDRVHWVAAFGGRPAERGALSMDSLAFGSLIGALAPRPGARCEPPWPGSTRRQTDGRA